MTLLEKPSYLAIAKSALRFHLRYDLQLLKVDFDPLVALSCYRLLGTPRSSVAFSAYPTIRHNNDTRRQTKRTQLSYSSILDTHLFLRNLCFANGVRVKG